MSCAQRSMWCLAMLTTLSLTHGAAQAGLPSRAPGTPTGRVVPSTVKPPWYWTAGTTPACGGVDGVSTIRKNPMMCDYYKRLEKKCAAKLELPLEFTSCYINFHQDVKNTMDCTLMPTSAASCAKFNARTAAQACLWSVEQAYYVKNTDPTKCPTILPKTPIQLDHAGTQVNRGSPTGY